MMNISSMNNNGMSIKDEHLKAIFVKLINVRFSEIDHSFRIEDKCKINFESAKLYLF